MSRQVTLTPAAERVLEVVETLFYDNGIHAVGVDMIAAEAGVTKKTLYDRFGSKDAIVRLYLERRDARWREHVTSIVEKPGRFGAKRRVLLMFDALESWMAAENPRGCAFVNALAELPDPQHPAREAIDDEKQWVLDYFRALVRETGARNQRKLAASLFLLYDGAIVSASYGMLPDAVATARDAAAQLLDSALD
ncbi:TetR family transcriptional regulator [Saccharomonospora sp. CUA-673]|uniref:TetR/AcrR family transcriptional regulator n=1 Tax=Saccharomonospora sp. CUA-673 TaxID=1904969 RepID=UPI0009608D3C|nr:TetR/AcrR family transcriptional regulator [Saccharomonospora sp. CUA-673]OLT49191.1 TetR family transcriptional regulator [Saccharomonospora sp. CUA-673]